MWGVLRLRTTVLQDRSTFIYQIVTPSSCALYFQILLVWSRDVAHHDVTFVKGLLHSLMGMSGTAGQGGSNPPTRAQRSVDVQPQNIYEELSVQLHI